MEIFDTSGDAVNAELERLLNTEEFRRAPSHSRLLRYLVERSAARDLSGLREAAIAMAVFRRTPAQYDPDHDPIVRVTIGRLRERLAKHYQALRPVPELMIQLPKGGYSPEFVALETKPKAPLFHGMLLLPVSNLAGERVQSAVLERFHHRLSSALIQSAHLRVISNAVNLAPDSSNAQRPAFELSISIEIERGGFLRTCAQMTRTRDRIIE